MADLNKWMGIGRVGQDPKISKTTEGREIASFSIATSEKWIDKRTGEVRQKTEWHLVVVFAESLVGIVKNYVKKGSKLYLEGKLQTRKWQDKNTDEARYTTEIVLNGFGATIQLLDSAKSGVQEEERKSIESSETSGDFVDDQIPF